MRSFWLGFLVCAAMFVACGDDDSKVSDSDQDTDEVVEDSDSTDVDNDAGKDVDADSLGKDPKSAKDSTSTKDSTTSPTESSTCSDETVDFCNSWEGNRCKYSKLTDARNGKSYKMVKIGCQWWMTENLNYKTDDSYCYQDSDIRCAFHGRLYTWKAAQGACPSGSHLPSKEEWKTLIAATGEKKALALKSEDDYYPYGTNHYVDANLTYWRIDIDEYAVDFRDETESFNMIRSKYGIGGGTDDFTFKAIPSGSMFQGTDGQIVFENAGQDALYWSSTESENDRAFALELYSGEFHKSFVNPGNVIDLNPLGRQNAFSVRCVLDKQPAKIIDANSSSKTKLLDKVDLPSPCKVGVDADCFMDDRDGQTYRVARIGDQVWTAQNMNYETGYSSCIGNDKSNCDKYGRFYTISELDDVCPSGWHVPDTAEWGKLKRAVGGDSVAGLMLKSKSGWVSGNGKDLYGFTALPVGKMSNRESDFIGENAFFWTSGAPSRSPWDNTDPLFYTVNMSFSESEISGWLLSKGDQGLSVRCIQNRGNAVSCKTDSDDKCAYGSLVDSRDGKTYKTIRIGGQNWMAENLNYETDSSRCYNDSAEYCAKYGRLYRRGDAMDSLGMFSTGAKGCGYNINCKLKYPVRGICPEGWHLPDSSEWNKLVATVGGLSEAALNLKSQSGWVDDHNGPDPYAFTALPAGYLLSSGKFDRLGSRTQFWGSLDDRDSHAFTILDYRDYIVWNGVGNAAISIRCLEDDETVSKPPARECKTSSIDTCEYDELTDARDGQTYKTVKIGDQWWMAENLNYSYLEPTPQEDSSSFCYDNLPENCEKYGRLYLWNAAMDNICPEGWHLPDSTEWKILLKAVGGSEIAGRELKSTSGWRLDYTTDINNSFNGVDSYGFNALPAGFGSVSGNIVGDYREYRGLGSNVDFLNSSKENQPLGMDYLFSSASFSSNKSGIAYSARCLKD